MVFWIASMVGLTTAYLFGSTPTGYLAGKRSRALTSESMAPNQLGQRTYCEPWGNGVGGPPGRCAEGRGGGRVCPLVLSLVLHIAVGHATAVEKFFLDREGNSSRQWRVLAQRHVTKRGPEFVIFPPPTSRSGERP
jgi:hypothetical protein